MAKAQQNPVAAEVQQRGFWLWDDSIRFNDLVFYTCFSYNNDEADCECPLYRKISRTLFPMRRVQKGVRGCLFQQGMKALAESCEGGLRMSALSQDKQNPTSNAQSVRWRKGMLRAAKAAKNNREAGVL